MTLIHCAPLPTMIITKRCARLKQTMRIINIWCCWVNQLHYHIIIYHIINNHFYRSIVKLPIVDKFVWNAKPKIGRQKFRRSWKRQKFRAKNRLKNRTVSSLPKPRPSKIESGKRISSGSLKRHCRIRWTTNLPLISRATFTVAATPSQLKFQNKIVKKSQILPQSQKKYCLVKRHIKLVSVNQ